MKNKIMWIITLISFIITMVAIQFMEDKVPMHYDVNGTIDRWGSKNEQFIFPVVIFLISVFWQCIISYFREKQKKATDEKVIQEAAGNEKVITYVGIAMALQFTIMHCFILYSAWNESKHHLTSATIDISSVSCLCIGLMLIVLGNMMPKVKKNSLMGVRTVWSMENDKTWAMSNRAGGVICMAAGFLIVFISCMLREMSTVIATVAIVIAAAVLACLYSFAAYKRYR